MYSVSVEDTFAVSIEEAWQLWTDPTILKQWFAPGDMTVSDTHIEATIGAPTRFCMKHADGTDYCSSGIVTVLDKPNKLAYSWKWEMAGDNAEETQVTISFAAHSDTHTTISLTHEGFAKESESQEHNKGWHQIFTNLKHYIED